MTTSSQLQLPEVEIDRIVVAEAEDDAAWDEVVPGFSYQVLLTKELEGGYTVTVPTLPGCITYGETKDEAISMAYEAIDLYLESLEARGDAIPVEETRDLNDNTLLDLDADGNLVALTLEHAQVLTSVFELSFQQIVPARELAVARNLFVTHA